MSTMGFASKSLGPKGGEEKWEYFYSFWKDLLLLDHVSLDRFLDLNPEDFFFWKRHLPSFCQLEAVETAIWLTEVAPKSANGKRFLEAIKTATS